MLFAMQHGDERDCCDKAPPSLVSELPPSECLSVTEPCGGFINWNDHTGGRRDSHGRRRYSLTKRRWESSVDAVHASIEAAEPSLALIDPTRERRSENARAKGHLGQQGRKGNASKQRTSEPKSPSVILTAMHPSLPYNPLLTSPLAPSLLIPTSSGSNQLT